MDNYLVQNESELKQVAKEIIAKVKEEKTVLFYGEMGAGKTTLIKILCQELGFNGDVTSPTYALINEYPTSLNTIYHFDLFRLESIEEAIDIGIEEYLENDGICLIEWPQKIESLVDEGLKIEIEKIDINSRKISIFKF